MKVSRQELVDLAKAWIAISIAFSIVLTRAPLFSRDFFVGIVFAAFTVGVGFLFHEMAHKVVAQRYGCWAEFRAFDPMLLLAIALSFLGVVFAAPGAVMISGDVTKKENGLISVVGPWTNIFLALVFFLLMMITPTLSQVWGRGLSINLWLALFNMVPFWILDGKKVWVWNKAVWGGTVAVVIGLMSVI